MQEQPARAEQQHEPQMPPAVAPAAQVRRPRPAVRVEHRSAPRRSSSACRVALMTISLANSIPVVCSSIRSYAALLKPRRPQWKSPTGQWKKSRPMTDQDRIADPAVLPGHRAGHDPAPEAVAHHQVVALAQLLDERLDRREVVAVVGVAHDDVSAAGGGDAADAARCRSPWPRPATTRAPSRSAIACEPSVLPLSAIDDFAAIPCSRKARCAFSMQLASVSASFRQGITTENSGPCSPSPRDSPTDRLRTSGICIVVLILRIPQ